MRLLVAAALFSAVAFAQLSTGVVEGTVRTGAPAVIRGSLGFQMTVPPGPGGSFAVALPYGTYQFSTDGSPAIDVVVVPLSTSRLDVAVPERARTYPAAISLQGILLAEEPGSVTDPLDFTGLNDNHLALIWRRGGSWTRTQYTLMGMDATDSYQPGRPMILPDVQALDAVECGNRLGLFLRPPGRTWHATFATADTGSALTSSNLPPASQRGLVQQTQRFEFFTRDTIQAAGPIGRRADIAVTGTAQWSPETIPLQPAGTDQRSRLLFGDVRARFAPTPRDQVDGLYSGSRINLSDWGIPEGLEVFAGRRMAPPLMLPGGFPGQSGTDHLDFLQAGWTHTSSSGVLEVRYGESTAHMNVDPPAEIFGVHESRIELLSGVVSEAPPISDLAVRTRQGVEASWSRHRLTVGAGWKTSGPVNRVTIPSDISLTTIGGLPADVVEFNTPYDSREIVRSFSGYAADHIAVAEGFSLDFGALVDLSRGSLPTQAKGDGQFVHSQTFAARPDLIAWNSVSPRVGFSWQLPHLERLVLRGSWSRLYAPLAARYLDFGNPDSLSGNEYRWIDRNGDGRFQLGEEGTLLSRFGGAYSSIAPSVHRPYADEFDAGGEFASSRRTFVSAHFFRRDDKQRLAAINTGVPPSAFAPVATVWEQDPATLGQDRYLLTNPAGLRALSSSAVLEAGADWRGLLVRGSFVAEKSYGLTNPGDASFENDPGVVGSLFSDPNTTIGSTRHNFTDRARVAKVQAGYRLPLGVQILTLAQYVGGLAFSRQSLITGLPQGPFLVGTGEDRAQAEINWDLQFLREFQLRPGRLVASAEILNVANAGRAVQETHINGLRMPVQFQEPRTVRFQLRYEF